jgi:hypothetical protein
MFPPRIVLNERVYMSASVAASPQIVIPAKAGIQGLRRGMLDWTPAFAGVTA